MRFTDYPSPQVLAAFGHFCKGITTRRELDVAMQITTRASSQIVRNLEHLGAIKRVMVGNNNTLIFEVNEYWEPPSPPVRPVVYGPEQKIQLELVWKHPIKLPKGKKRDVTHGVWG